jgi:hypothetical protein
MIDNAEQRGWCVANSNPGKSHKADPQGTRDTHHLIESLHSVTPNFQLRRDALSSG